MNTRDRFQWGLTYEGGADDMISSASTSAQARVATVALARKNACGGWVYDAMAHPGRPQLWRWTPETLWSVAERRP